MFAFMTATETKWSERVREWRSGGQSAHEYAQGRGFAGSTLSWWASRLGRRGATDSTGDGATASKRPSGVRMARVVTPSRRREPTLTVRVGVAQVEVRAGFDRALLRELVDVLGGRP